MLSLRRGWLAKLAGLAIVTLSALPAQAQIGVIFTGAGAVNRSMSGASTAAPLDGAGAMYWNPATISGLPSSSIDFGVELLWPQTRLGSSLPANAFGAGVPAIGLAGSDRGDNGVFALPTMALVYRPDGSEFTYGLGVFAVGGFGTNYPASNVNPLAGQVNPILTPQPPNGFGVGALYASLSVIELVPTVSVQITDRLAIGGGPTVTAANLALDPLLLVAPNANGYPPGTHTRNSWGGGFQIGAYYNVNCDWNVGISLKSTQWLEGFHYQSIAANGTPRNLYYRFDIPLIASIGVGYTGIERWTLAADFRYVDYGNTEGFKQQGFGPNGEVRGLGWRSVFAMALGAQYQMSDTLSLRIGYSYNQNPIRSDVQSFNIFSPTILEHSITCGASYNVTDAFSLSLGYIHCFQNSTEGPIVTPAGAIAGSSVRSTTSADAIMIGATVKFGPR